MNMPHRRTSALALAGLLCAAACAGQPPATSPAADDTLSQFVWQDLMTEDVDAAISFYGALLGWEFEESTRLGQRYVLAKAEGAYVAGINHVERTAGSGAGVDQWVSYLSVADVDPTVAQVTSAGGRVLAGPVDLTTARAAIVADTEGAALGLVQLPAQLGEAARQALDAEVFIWRDYLADDVPGALSFYRDIAGFQAERSTSGSGPVHYVLRRGTARAGLFDIGSEPVEPNWLVYVKVADAAASARRAEQLGGHVLLAPGSAVRNGTLAVVADPGGAGIALQQWPINAAEDR